LHTVGVHEPDFTGTDSVIDPVLSCGFSDDASSHLSLGPRSFRKPIGGDGADQRARPAPEGRSTWRTLLPQLLGGGQVETPQWGPRFQVVKMHTVPA